MVVFVLYFRAGFDASPRLSIGRKKSNELKTQLDYPLWFRVAAMLGLDVLTDFRVRLFGVCLLAGK